MMSNPETPNNTIEEQAEEKPKKATRGRPRKPPKEEPINPEPKKETRGRPKKPEEEKVPRVSKRKENPLPRGRKQKPDSIFRDTEATKEYHRQYFLLRKCEYTCPHCFEKLGSLLALNHHTRHNKDCKVKRMEHLISNMDN